MDEFVTYLLGCIKIGEAAFQDSNGAVFGCLVQRLLVFMTCLLENKLWDAKPLFISLPDVLFFLPKDMHASQQSFIPGTYWHPPHSTVSPFERLLQGK